MCDNPQANTSCLILPRIAEEKDDAAEQRVAAKFWRELPEPEWPACAVERGAFMSGGSFTRLRVPSLREIEQGSQALRCDTL